jgi:nucleoid DNA-binding protein
MEKTQLIAALAEKAGISKAGAQRYVDAVLGIIADNITNGDGVLSITDFGRFEVRQVAERNGVNPATQEKITIPAHDRIVFRASDNMDIYSRKHQAEF